MAIGASIIGAIGGLAGSAMQASAAKSAARLQAGAANRATDAQLSMFGQIRDDLRPFMEPGIKSLNMLMDRMGEFTTPFEPTIEELEGTPGYQFVRDQGLKGVQNSAAARGLGTSGPALRSAAGFATDLANTTFNDRLQNELSQRGLFFNMLMGPAQIGAGAAAGTASAGAQISPGVASSIMAGGNALAGGRAAAGAAWGSGISNAANMLASGIMSNQLMQRL